MTRGSAKVSARPERIEAAPVEEQVRPREEVPEHGDHHPAEQAGIGVVGDQVGRVPRQRAGYRSPPGPGTEGTPRGGSGVSRASALRACGAGPGAVSYPARRPAAGRARRTGIISSRPRGRVCHDRPARHGRDSGDDTSRSLGGRGLPHTAPAHRCRGRPSPPADGQGNENGKDGDGAQQENGPAIEMLRVDQRTLRLERHLERPRQEPGHQWHPRSTDGRWATPRAAVIPRPVNA